MSEGTVETSEAGRDGGRKDSRGPVVGALDRIRAGAAAIQRALALGTLALLLGALLNMGLVLGVLAPLAGGTHLEPGVGADLLASRKPDAH